jgi:hypothetical protein
MFLLVTVEFILNSFAVMQRKAFGGSTVHTNVRLNQTDNSPFLTTSCPPSIKQRSSSEQNILEAYFPVTNIYSYTHL